MSKRKGLYAGKVKKAAQILLYKRHQKPGVKGWELKKAVGSDFGKVLEVLDDYLEPMDLMVKVVFDEEKAPEKPSEEQLEKARFFVTLRGESLVSEPKMIGWRVDDLAGLAVTISYIISKDGQVPRKDLEKLLGEKMPNWKVGLNIDRYIRYGYLMQDEKGLLFLDWRTRAEIDQKALIDMLLNSEPKGEMQQPEEEEPREEE
ncbi:MAG: hypothetical protein NWF00_03215 [Candidatus Bathyarchaeota archaeon]|nr:hypothetical protein [Candidatus Bathyarchaeota archaeon]